METFEFYGRHDSYRGKQVKLLPLPLGWGILWIFRQSDPVKRKLCIELAKELALVRPGSANEYNSGTIPVRNPSAISMGMI